MKKSFIIFFLFLFYSPIFSNWFYDEEKKVLLYNNQPFITYSPVITPIGLYYFEKFGNNVYNSYGWFRKSPLKESFNRIDPPKDGEENGWFIYDGNIDYPYIEGWLYFPEKRLFIKTDIFFNLYRLWDRFYFNLKKLDSNIYNRVEKKFYRVETPYLSKKTDYVEIDTEDFIVVYQKVSDLNSPKYIFIVYPYFKTTKEYYSIKIIYYKNNRVVKTELIKCI